MYSPKIDKHTPNIYRLAQALGKPMTKVADDLISFALVRLDSVYTGLDQQKIYGIVQNANGNMKSKNHTP